jgi:hypothetical protein
MTPDLDAAILFLSRLRPAGPWILIGIVPDADTVTRTFAALADSRNFISAHNPDKNVYYGLNPTREPMSKKPKKVDILRIEFVQADLDPAEGETAEAAKKRYLEKLAAFEFKPTFIIDSGNGIQALWRLDPAVGPERLAHAEAVSKEIMIRLGSKAGTQNVDRILRLPGTINWPNKVKLAAGRSPVMAQCLAYNEFAVYALEDFGIGADEAPPTAPADHEAVLDSDILWWTIQTGGRYAEKGTRSNGVWWVTMEMLRWGYSRAFIRRTLLDKRNAISAHIYDQPAPGPYTDAQVEKACKEISFSIDSKTGRPYCTRHNLRVAMLKLGVTVHYDQFSDRMLITGLAGFGPHLTDEAVLHIRMKCEHVFKFFPGKDMSHEVVQEMTRLNQHHPVREYFDNLKWDGVARLDKWLSTYSGADDTPYTNAIGALLLIAAVRRVRQPGAKFDECVVLESPLQGTNKSTALEILATRSDWFSDNLPFNLEGKQVIEALQGYLIVEAAELSGMRRAEVEHLKAFLSRTVDRGRLSYDRITKNVPRQCVIVGTTNDSHYLKDTSGNRRFWPVRIKEFDLAALKRDRDQLWAEAVVREAAGASIRMDQSLWADATSEQLKRVVNDTIYDTLHEHLGALKDPELSPDMRSIKIAQTTIFQMLDLKPGMAGQDHNARIGKAMRLLGFMKGNSAGQIKVHGKNISGWVRGDVPRTLVVWVRGTNGHSGQWGIAFDDEEARPDAKDVL